MNPIAGLLSYAGAAATEAVLTVAAANLARTHDDWSEVAARARYLLRSERLSLAGVMTVVNALARFPDQEFQERLFRESTAVPVAVRRAVLEGLASNRNLAALPELIERAKRNDYLAARSIGKYSASDLETREGSLFDLFESEPDPAVALWVAVGLSRFDAIEPFRRLFERVDEADFPLAWGNERQIRRRVRGALKIDAATGGRLAEIVRDRPRLAPLVDELVHGTRTVIPDPAKAELALGVVRDFSVAADGGMDYGVIRPRLALLSHVPGQGFDETMGTLLLAGTGIARSNRWSGIADEIALPLERRARESSTGSHASLIEPLRRVLSSGGGGDIAPSPEAILEPGGIETMIPAMLDHMATLDAEGAAPWGEFFCRATESRLPGDHSIDSDEVPSSARPDGAEFCSLVIGGYEKATALHPVYPIVRRVPTKGERPSRKVSPGARLDVEIGLDSRPDPDAAIDQKGSFPSKQTFEVKVSVFLEGLSLVDYNNRRFKLIVSELDRYPTRTMQLAVDDEPPDEVYVAATFDVEDRSIATVTLRLTTNDKEAVDEADNEVDGETEFVRDAGVVSRQQADLTEGVRFDAVFEVEITTTAIVWRCGDAGDKQSTPPDGKSPQQFAHEIRELFNRARSQPGKYADEIDYYLVQVGRLVPRKMQSLYADKLTETLRNDPTRRPLIELRTDEPYIPWELALLEGVDDSIVPAKERREGRDPSARGRASIVSPIMGALAGIGRVLVGRSNSGSAPFSSVSSIGIVAPDYGADAGGEWSAHAAMKDERDDLIGLGAELLTDEHGDLIKRLIADSPGILHFVAHGARHGKKDSRKEEGSHEEEGSTRGSGSGFVRVLRTELQSDTGTEKPRRVVVRLTHKQLTKHPAYMENTALVFLNACEAGVGDAGLVGEDGLVQTFFQMGADVVLAPIWEIDSTKAREVARHFYADALGSPPVELGEVIRRVLDGVDYRDPENVTPLAYRLYGHPGTCLKYTRNGGTAR